MDALSLAFSTSIDSSCLQMGALSLAFSSSMDVISFEALNMPKQGHYVHFGKCQHPTSKSWKEILPHSKGQICRRYLVPIKVSTFALVLVGWSLLSLNSIKRMCCVSLEALIGYTCFYLGEVYFEECEDYLKAINKFHKNYEDFFLKLDENARFIIQNISTNVNQPLTAKQSVWEDGRHI